MKKSFVLLLCLMLILGVSTAFAATTAQQTAPAAAQPAQDAQTTINAIILDDHQGPKWLPTFGGDVDIQGMPSTSLSPFTYIPSQPNGALVDNMLMRQYGIMLNLNADGTITSNTAYHLNGNVYVNYYQPGIVDAGYLANAPAPFGPGTFPGAQFNPTFEGSGYIYNIAPYLGFINYQAGRMAYAPGAGLLLYSNMDGVQLNFDFGQLQVNVYGGNDTTPAMQSTIAPTNIWLFQSADCNPFPGYSPIIVGPGQIQPFPEQTGLGARVAAIDASYSFNNPWTVKAGFSDVFAANNGGTNYQSGPSGVGDYETRITMMDLGVFYDDGTWSGRARAGYSPSNDLSAYKSTLKDNMCMLGMDAKVQYGRYDISTPGTYDAAAIYSKVGPLAGFSPDAPLISNSGEAIRVFGDYVIDTNFKANAGYTWIQGLQPTTAAQVTSLSVGVKPAYDTSSIFNLGLTYYF